jgi:hypothetical protein
MQLFSARRTFREFPKQSAASLGETAGVYHFGLECPSGKLSGFLAFVENQAPPETPGDDRLRSN